MQFQLTKCIKIHLGKFVDRNSYYSNDPRKSCEDCVYISQINPASLRNKASKKTSNKVKTAKNNHNAVCLDCRNTKRCFCIFDLFFFVDLISKSYFMGDIKYKHQFQKSFKINFSGNNIVSSYRTFKLKNKQYISISRMLF